jgi:membrane-associated phospholipid phosphatase
MRALLLAIMVLLMMIALIWQQVGQFHVDFLRYGAIMLLMAAFMAGAIFYMRVRQDQSIASMLFGLGFMLGAATSLHVINYFGLTIAGSRIDGLLAEWDRAIGVDWPALMRFAASHRNFNFVILVAYSLSTWQIIVLMLCMGWRDRTFSVEQLCLAVIISGIVAVFFWIAFPSFGAITVYGLPPEIATKLPLALNLDYAHSLTALFAHGPGTISPTTTKGLVGFPSFHTAEAVVATWYARRLKFLFYVFLLFNVIVIVATPIQGGHHVVDTIAGVVVAAFAIFVSSTIAARLAQESEKEKQVSALVTAS